MYCISDVLITRIPADEEPLCGNAAVYAVIVIVIIIIIIIIIIIMCYLLCSPGGSLLAGQFSEFCIL